MAPEAAVGILRQVIIMIVVREQEGRSAHSPCDWQGVANRRVLLRPHRSEFSLAVQLGVDRAHAA